MESCISISNTALSQAANEHIFGCWRRHVYMKSKNIDSILNICTQGFSFNIIDIQHTQYNEKSYTMAEC